MIVELSRKDFFILALSYILINTNLSFSWSLFRVFIFKQGASFTEIALVSFINSMTSILFSPFFGALSDELGKRKAFLVLSTILIALISPVYSFLHSPIEFIAVYAFSTIAMAITTPILNAILSEVSTTETRGRTLGVFYGVASISWILSGSLGGYLLETIGYGFTFIAFGILCLTGGVLLAHFYYEPPDPHVPLKIAIRKALNKQKTSLGFFRVSPKLRVIILSVLFHGIGTGIAFTLFVIKLFIAVKKSYIIYGIIAGISGIPSVFAPIIYGYLGDRYGKKKVMVWTLFAYSIYFIVIGILWDPIILAILWILPLWPGIRISTIALVADISKKEEFGFSQGQVTSAMAFARAIGAIIGGVVADIMNARINIRALDSIIATTAVAPFIAALILLRLRDIR